jgi:hypothetical protein
LQTRGGLPVVGFDQFQECAVRILEAEELGSGFIAEADQKELKGGCFRTPIRRLFSHYPTFTKRRVKLTTLSSGQGRSKSGKPTG